MKYGVNCEILLFHHWLLGKVFLTIKPGQIYTRIHWARENTGVQNQVCIRARTFWNVAFRSLIHEQELRLSFLMYFHRKFLQLGF